jgi:HEAT repeat protein
LPADHLYPQLLAAVWTRRKLSAVLATSLILRSRFNVGGKTERGCTMKTDSAASRRCFLKTSVSAAAGLGGLPFAGASSLRADDQEPLIEGKTIGQLIAQLKDENHSVRRAAASVLDRIGPEAKAAVPALTNALKDNAAHVRYAAAKALGKTGPEAKGAVPALTEVLQDRHAGVRVAAATALIRIGAEAKGLVSPLTG